MERLEVMSEQPIVGIPIGHDNLSLNALEEANWGSAPEDATSLVARVHALRDKPIGSLPPGDLRLLIRQSVGLKFLVPCAVKFLGKDPLVEAELYPGDLLAAVLRVDQSYWSTRPDLAAEVESMIQSIESPSSDIAEDIRAFRHRA
jgi:contact-dependent growth inhibition (CDI) system CdiI-like immunity protein